MDTRLIGMSRRFCNMVSLYRSQFGLLRRHREVGCILGDSFRILMDIGQWSLELYSVRTFHSVFGAKALLDIVRSITEKELWVTLWRVYSPVLSSVICSFSKKFSIVLPLVSVLLDPQILFRLLKSPRNKKGFGSCLIIWLR
jgi:hypothetical protein